MLGNGHRTVSGEPPRLSLSLPTALLLSKIHSTMITFQVAPERIDPRHLPTFLQTAVERLRLEFGENLVSVALYGSRARGEARPDSDVDLLAIVRDLPTHWQERTRALHEPLRGISTDLEFSVYGKTPAEFDANFPSIYLDMGLDSIILYDPDNYLTPRLQRIREIIAEGQLFRDRIGDNEFFWDWNAPVGSPWVLDWEGLREIA